jgi:MSHA biogenesis protein MshQ
MSITNDGNTVNIATNNDNAGAAGTSAYTSTPLLFGPNATADIILNYPDAGQMQLHATYNIPDTDFAIGTSGSSNLFVVRPFGFAITDIRNYGADTTYDNADDVLNSGGTASGGSPFIAAEDVFRVSIQGYQYDAADDSNNDGIPDIGADISDNGNGTTPNFAWDTTVSAAASDFTPAGGAAGTISGDTSLLLAGFSSGGITPVNLSYDDVGSVTLQALATDYISAGIDVYGYSSPVGRFYPDHFTLNSSTITPACGAFTYMGQAFGIAYELQARGLNEGIPGNYDTAAGYPTAMVALRAENNSDGTDMGARLANASSSWSAGTYAINTSAAIFNRAASHDGAYTSLQLGLDITSELDDRDIENMDMLTNSAKAFGTTDVRFGRLRIGNAFGSELLPLTIPLFAEYYNDDGSGGGFVTNSNDSCTSYDALDATPDTNAEILALSNYLPNLDSGETTPSGNGFIMNGTNDPANSISLSAPGSGNDGSVDMTLSVSSWLLYDWDGDGNHDNNPTGTATFGIFGGNDATIYRRELY